MNDIFKSPAFQEFLQKRCEEITNGEDNIKTGQAIIQLEQELIKFASENVRNIYFQIDYLVHKQQEEFRSSLIKLR